MNLNKYTYLWIKSNIFAHKKGSCGADALNDVGVIYPDNGKSIYISVFVDGERTSFKQREKTHQDIAKAITELYSE